jgi:parallel beta-helix repeat protein
MHVTLLGQLKNEAGKEILIRIIATVLLTLLLATTLAHTLNLGRVKAQPAVITVPNDFPTIQEAINKATSGDTVKAQSGTYYENVVVNKTVSLIGEDSSTTIIDGNKTGTVVTIEASDVTIGGFTIQNSGNATESNIYPLDSGIKLAEPQSIFQDVTVENNNVINNTVGIYLEYSNNNTISNNTFHNNVGPPFLRVFDPENPWAWPWPLKGQEDDIYLSGLNETRLADNMGVSRLFNSSLGFVANSSEVFLSFSDLNTIANCSGLASLLTSNNNTISHCASVSLMSSDNNTITHCLGGIDLRGSNYNIIESNTLSSGKSIELPATEYGYGAPWPPLGSQGNLITDNNLTNGGIKVGWRGGTVSPSDDNVIANNTLIGGYINICGSGNAVTRNHLSMAGVAIQTLPVQDSKGSNKISQNEIANATTGLSIESDGDIIAGNVVRFSELGMYIQSSNSTIINNTVAENDFGLYLVGNDNKLSSNNIYDNNYSFIESLTWFAVSYFSPPSVYVSTIRNDVDTSNTVNGKPVYYLTDEANIDVNPASFPDVGYLALTSCVNVTVRGLTLTGNGQGILLSNCTNCTVEGNTIRHNLIAISAYTNDTVFSNNIISENYHGMTSSGSRNEISNNIISNNTFRLAPYRWPDNWPKSDPISNWMSTLDVDQYTYLMAYSGGIYLRNADNSTIYDNDVDNNEYGILLYRSSFNVFKNNSIVGNVYNFGVDPSCLFPPEVRSSYYPETAPYLMNDVDTSNRVNGKPIYWWVNRHGEQVPTDAGFVVLVDSTNMAIKNLVLANNTEGMLLSDVNDTVVFNNTITDSKYGILIKPGFDTYTTFSQSWNANMTYFSAHTVVNNTIISNNVARNGIGVYLVATNSTISHCLIDENLAGIYAVNDFDLIMDNIVANNTYPPQSDWVLGFEPDHQIPDLYFYYSTVAVGIILESANNDTVCYNTVQNNDCGLAVDAKTYSFSGLQSQGGCIFSNNFINNTSQAALGSASVWDSGYPSGGNYWSDYNGTDMNQDQYQNQTGSDGIGDAPYNTGQWAIWSPIDHGNVINKNQLDQYPLMAPINIFEVVALQNASQHVDIVSNSTISVFCFNPSKGAFLKFDATGESGTDGFCRVSIPKDLLKVEDGCTVLIGFEPVNYTIATDRNYAYLYFAYGHSTKTVYIIGTSVVQEFPQQAIPPLLIIFFILLLFLKKRRVSKKSQSSTFSVCYSALQDRCG